MTTRRVGPSFDYMIALDSAGKPLAVCEFDDDACWRDRFVGLQMASMVPARASSEFPRTWEIVITRDGKRITGVFYSPSIKALHEVSLWREHQFLTLHNRTESDVRAWANQIVGQSIETLNDDGSIKQ